jgi:2',3'-cyclic-nucleotide 2'-phosphodiesterase (5'-nucleotidase family)
VVILGLTTEATAQTTRPQNVKGLWFLNAVKTAKELLKGLSERDLVIALTHLGVKKDIKLAKSCPRINVIVGGHSHTALFEPLKVNDTIIVQAGAYAEYLGRLDLEVTDGKVVWYKGALIPLSPDIEEDKQIASVIDEYKSKMAARFEEVIGRTELFLDGSRHGVRSGKNTNLGSLITYTAARALGVQAALINGGTIRASINAGDITLDAIYTVLPFSDYLVGMDLTGEDILAALQRSSDLNEGSGGKLQTYGILFRNEGGKVVIEKVGGIPFSPKKYYSIATNDFLAEGGDGYNMLKEKGTNSYRSPILLSSAFVDLIKERKVITPEIINSVR